MDKILTAEQLRRAIQIVLQNVTDEEAIMEVPYVYNAWDGESHAYKTGEILSFGVNGVGDPQLYQVLQSHTSQPDWTPDTAVSLFKTIGISAGHPVWSQPVGAVDAYNTGDIVWFPEADTTLYRSIIDGNVWSPTAYPQGWTEE